VREAHLYTEVPVREAHLYTEVPVREAHLYTEVPTDMAAAEASLHRQWGPREWFAHFSGEGVTFPDGTVPENFLVDMVHAMRSGDFPHPTTRDFGVRPDGTPHGAGGADGYVSSCLASLAAIALDDCWVSEDESELGGEGGSYGSMRGYRGQRVTFVAPESAAASLFMSSYYTGAARLVARRSDERQSAAQYWRTHALDLVRDSLRWRDGRISLHTLAASCHYCLKQPTTFPPVVARAFIERFGMRTVLDPCAGWGDRLLGAMTARVDGARVRYVGVDPNPRLTPGFDAAIAENGATDAAGEPLYRVLCAPFESLPLPGEEPEHPVNAHVYDGVLTSPPYFDTEIYNEDDPAQSMRHAVGRTRAERLRAWKEGFLYRLVDGALARLRTGGRMCLSLADTRAAACVEDVIKYVASAYPAVEFEGVIPFTREGSRGAAAPVWIWLKRAP
jgi:hypothetical protein